MSLFDSKHILYNHKMSERVSKVKKILPGLQDIIFLSIFCAAILMGPRMLNMDGDLPKHLAIGKYVLQGNPPPLYDIFSHTKYGTPFAPHKWLSGLLFYISYILFAEKGIVILSGVLLAGTFTLIYKDSVSRTNLRFSTFFVVIWGAAVSSLHWISRPHLFTMLMLATSTFVYDAYASCLAYLERETCQREENSALVFPGWNATVEQHARGVHFRLPGDIRLYSRVGLGLHLQPSRDKPSYWKTTRDGAGLNHYCHNP